MMKLTQRSVVALLALTLGLSSRAAEPAAEDPANLNQTEILKRLLIVSEELRKIRAELDELKAERARAAAPAPATAAAVVAPVAAPPPAEQPAVNEEQARIERERAVQSVQRSGVLLARGKVEVEPGLSYSHASSNLISIDGFALLPILVIGDIQSLRLERDVFTTSLSGRYGLWHNLQLDAAVPWIYERDRFVTQTQTDPDSGRQEKTIQDEGLGDVSFGLARQVFFERGNLPDVILSVRATAPTGKSIFDIGSASSATNVTTASELALGSGVWSVRGGLTAIKSLDPVVLIFNAGYTHSFARSLSVSSTNGVIRTVDYQPGGVVDYGVAVAIAMNPSFAVNLQLQQRITFDTELKGIGEVEGSATVQADLRFGFAWALNETMVLNFTAAAGLTEDSPDFSISVGLPIKF